MQFDSLKRINKQEKMDNKQTVLELLSILDDREAEIITRYYGLLEEPVKLEEIGNDILGNYERLM